MSTKIPVIDLKGKETGQHSVDAGLFAIEPNESAVQAVVKGQLFRFYKKTATTKGRSAVSGGGKKSRKQKGGGCSRQGGRRGPQWVGGGIVFGPTGMKRDYKVNKKMRKLAFASVLSDRASGGQIRLLKDNVDKPASKVIAELLKALKLSDARVGFVVTSAEQDLIKSVRNIKRVDVLTEEKWTPYDIVRTDSVIFSEGALKGIEDHFNKEEGAKA